MLSLRTHNILDYVGGALLVVSPFLFGFSKIDSARNAFLVLGLGLIGYSLLTKYYYAIWKIIPVGLHMGMDVASGAAIILAPYILGYNELLSDGQLAVHYLLGLGVFALVVLTRNRATPVKLRQDETPPFRRAA